MYNLHLLFACSHAQNEILQVSGSNPSDLTVALAASYDLVAESCVPGIITSDWREIFEEQCVVLSLAELLEAANKGGREGRGGGAAGAGAVTLGEGDVGGSGGGSAGARAGGRVCFAEEERMFSYGR